MLLCLNTKAIESNKESDTTNSYNTVIVYTEQIAPHFLTN